MSKHHIAIDLSGCKRTVRSRVNQAIATLVIRTRLQHCPCVGDLVQLRLRGLPETLSLAVKKRTHSIDEDSHALLTTLHLTWVDCKKALSIPDTPFLPAVYRTMLDWPADICPPRMGEPIALRQNEAPEPRRLEAGKVIHDISLADETHTIRILVYDATPQPVFNVEEMFRQEED